MTTSTGSITSTGIGSGLDVSSIVASLMAVESRPLTLLQQAKTDLTTQVSSFGQLQSLTSTMRDAANALASVSLWNQTVASSSDSASVGVSTASGAAVGSYNIAVGNLATVQTVSSRALADSTSTLGEGTLTIELGSWTGEPTPTGFTPKTGSSAINITIGPGETSLASVRDKINAAGAGVTATIVKDASGSRLAIRSSSTGAENAFRISATETNDDGDATTGLSMLSYDATAPSQLTRSQSAVNANATINGIAVTSASNTLDGVADGLTLTLLKPTTTDVAVGVTADDNAVKTAVTTFTTAFNALASFIQAQTKYDATSKTGGALQGDRTVGGLQSQLRNVLNQATGASSVYTRLSDIGISMKSDGTLTTDSTKLTAAIANRTEMRKALATDGATTAVSGFMDRFRDLGNSVLGTDGSLTTRQASLQAMITRNTNSQTAMQERLDNTQARLQKQYQALDTSMSQLSSLSSYLTGQLAAIAKAASA